MITKQVDYNEALKVLSHPEILDCITDDGQELPTTNPDPEAEYIAGYINDEIIGIMIYHHYLDSIKCHVQVLPAHRADHAREFGEKALAMKDGPIYATIPELYPNVLRFAGSFGFEPVGQTPSTGTKNGKKYNNIELVRI